MIKRKNRKRVVREYRKDTFKAHQEAKVNEREQAIHETLVLLGKSGTKFSNVTRLAEYISALLNKEGKQCNVSTLLRKHHSIDGAEAPNPYRLLLEKYLMGKYFAADKNKSITAQDIEDIRRKNPAVDAYCSMKEGESKNFQEQVKYLNLEVARLQQGGKTLQHETGECDLSKQLDKTITALKHLLDASKDFYDLDWQQRAIVDISHRNPTVIVEPDLLSAFFKALENSGIKPPEGR